ncbi:MAG: CvpA family protein [Thermomicrobiales bacterium]|nr:CvpA family protein [Thermomicrobiales bacterium]
MPQVDTPLLLDILLGLVILLFVPFGIRRGVAKEAMVSAGIFLGATLAERLTPAWGPWLSERFGLAPGTSAFLVSAGLLFGGAFLLGYGGGAALGTPRLGVLSRLVGGLLAAFNAALLLSYLLAWIERDLGQGGTLDDGYISPWLLQRTTDLLLAAAGVLVVMTVLAWIVNLFRSQRQPRADDAYPARAARPAPVTPESGKYEPADNVARSGRFAPGLDATSPLPAAAPSGAPWAANAGRTVNGNGRESPLASAAADETVWAPWDSQGGRSSAGSAARTEWPVAPAVGVTPDERCAVCHARVGPRDVFCPECGATL